MSTTIRQATASDAPAIAGLIKELADFERMPNGPELSTEQLAADIESGAVYVKLAVATDGAVGIALYYEAYSSWQGVYLHLEDLYVRPSQRRQGLARQLVVALAKEAQKRDIKRINWHVLNWNQTAIDFYKQKLNATDLSASEGWLLFRLDESRIRELIQAQ